jgi:hypothetical protein
MGIYELWRKTLKGSLSLYTSKEITTPEYGRIVMDYTMISEHTTLVIDYHKSLNTMVDLGRYDWVNKYITCKLFPVTSNETAEYESRLFQFRQNISSEIAVSMIRIFDSSNSWTPAKIEHLLAFGVKYPSKQCNYPIVALGSIGELARRSTVPVLQHSGSKRHLRIDCWDGNWSALYCFLAVRNISYPCRSRCPTQQSAFHGF